ncbi:MAG TPA: hydroxyacid dehydrogenase [Planctomycetota bacterium]|nr:hydroxyacid dehydrogenase [Planctomycetota bacterium]
MSTAIVVCVSENEWAGFVAPNDLPDDLVMHRVSPAEGVDGIVAALSRTGAATLMTCWSTPPLPADLRARAPGLRYVCHLCGTVRRLVPRALIEQGLLVSNWADAHAFTVAEHCVALVLAGMRRLSAAHEQLHHATGWSVGGPPPRSLRGRRVGLHGFGVVARELARLLAPFGCSLSAFAPGDDDALLASRGVARAATVDALYAASEVLVCLAPWTPRTQGSVDARVIGLLPRDALFVNVGRGAVVDEAALAAAAASGRIQVALDVYVEEPLPAASPLRALTDAVLTPHVAGPTTDQQHACGRVALDNLRAFARGQTVRGVVDLARYDTIT